MCKILYISGKRSLLPALLLFALTFSATPAWSEPGEYGTKEALYPYHEGYGVHKAQQRWLVQNDRGTKRKSYQGLSPEEKSRLNGKIKKWKSLPPEEQNRLRYRMKEYKQLPSQDRELYQKRFQQMKKLPPGEREKVKNKLKKWDSLSPKEKEELRRKFKNQ